MTKAQRIENILENYSSDLVWELDEQQYYALIGCNYNETPIRSYWLVAALEVQTVPFINELTDKLKTELTS